MDISKVSLPKLIDNSEKIIEGSSIQKLDSLLISTKLVEMWKAKNVDVALGSRFLLRYYDGFKKNLEVSGIFESDIPEVRTTQETIDSILNKEVTGKRIYVSLMDDLSSVYQNIEKLDPNFVVLHVFGAKRFEIIFNTGIFSFVFQFVFSIIFLVAIVSFFTMSLILTKSKKRDMMVMKILGVKFWQIVYYSFGSFWVILCSVFVIFVILSFGLAPLIHNLTFSDLDYTSLYYERLFFWLILIWFVTFIFFTFIYLLSSLTTNMLSYRKIKR